MDKIYIGIDPGSDGAMCVMWPDIPATDENPGMAAHVSILPFKDANNYKVADTLRLAMKYAPVAVAVEDVHAMPRQGSASTFSFGFNAGVLHGLLIANAIPFVTVRPQDWQSEIWIRQDKEYVSKTKTLKDGSSKAVKQIEPKKTSINAATRLFPSVPLLRTPKSTKPHDGMADALLIAEYARRKNL